MGHHIHAHAYDRLSQRLNRFPQGAPPTELLFRILSMLFSEREADLVARLPIKPFTEEQAARAWSMDPAEARAILIGLADRGLLVDLCQQDTTHYVLPPPMAGFFEFSLMRVRTDIDQKALSELFYQYLNVEEDFVRDLFVRGETQLGRTFVHESVLTPENSLHILDYERASEVIRGASHRAVSLCYCRHKMQHLDRACDAPLEICMTFNTSAASLIRHGIARSVDEAECLDLLQQARDLDLVQFGENVRERVNFICNCCRCCCEAMIAARRFASLHPVHTTAFLPVVDADACTGCGRCSEVCPVDAVKLAPVVTRGGGETGVAVIQEDLCLGCALCVKNCPAKAITLVPRPARVITPLNTAHRTVVMAIERGTLQDLIFDNQVLWSHRALAGVLGAVLRLPPVKRALATEQVRSRYLEAAVRFIQKG
ncbi:MAG TPA: 4Fe-4S binding protein [Deltaproteobacteria bacterium]|nr:4Fe-4S binding protein [Deltaproteobacteria bacterium]HQI81702.1 4Fe-4S binding protein [Deltaproteobacteria bacterium]